MNKLRKNHKFLSVGGFMQQICKPLQHLNTHLFTYMKNFNDGTQLNLSTDPRWIEDYYALKLNESSYFESKPSLYATGFKWWPEASDSPVFMHGRDYYNSHYGITFCQQAEDGCEFFFFSSAKENKGMLDFYLNNLDLLEKFSLYFKDKASLILKDCNQHRINREINSASLSLFEGASERELFLQTTDLHTYQYDEFLTQYEPLTARERECLSHMLKEASAADVALAMKISPRTVETHIENIKSKLQCRSKNELMIKLLSYYTSTKK